MFGEKDSDSVMKGYAVSFSLSFDKRGLRVSLGYAHSVDTLMVINNRFCNSIEFYIQNRKINTTIGIGLCE